MSRRSSRLVSKGTSLLDDDAASTSSTGSAGHVSYKESPVRIFKKRRSAGSVSRSSSRASSVGQMLSGQRADLIASESEKGRTLAVQGFSSGYSSAEEHYDKPFTSSPNTGSAQSASESEFSVWDVFRSPAQALVLFYWWLGSTWYSFSSRVSMINVFLLSRCTSDIKKAAVLFLLLIFLIFGIWYWSPFATSSRPREVVSRTPPVKRTDEPVRAEVHDNFQPFAGLSNLKDDISSLYLREANLMRDIEVLKLESERQKVRSEMLQTDMRLMKDQIKSVETEHVQQVSDLKSSVTNLQSDSSLLKQRVDAQDALNINLKAELSEWLVKHLKDPRSTVVFRPELQRALEDLEKQILDKLKQDKESARDSWRTVGETLEQEGAGAVTIQDVKGIVNRAIELYRADGIGMADYALESSGASVINTRCSETYKMRSACLSLFGVPLWYQSESPRTVIQPELYPGKCWAFRGSQGFLVISLSYPIRITHVSLEHLPKVLSPTGLIDSALKDFAIYGMSEENEDGKQLATFMYDQDGEPIQTFKLPESSDIYSVVELRILSNWGHLEYTCVYRFRVHGEPSLG
ncbi:SUN domain-containing protein 2 [Triplophysa rosa]|uniref:SUN domain-containing protein 2-like n=1 Tax=Triplophysa rosa TaxID=992332 RepID=A0A9W8C4N2_TRIRA|nr:SUN domain-containing protein 2 [Triplophysa rosa]XP_057193600.1 SUN domain-containing protein 2 [Triplophysa rosa]KAI7807400.1 putative SUN domain-containing protein 2-like [Triplophysa rosa]